MDGSKVVFFLNVTDVGGSNDGSGWLDITYSIMGGSDSIPGIDRRKAGSVTGSNYDCMDDIKGVYGFNGTEACGFFDGDSGLVDGSEDSCYGIMGSSVGFHGIHNMDAGGFVCGYDVFMYGSHSIYGFNGAELRGSKDGGGGFRNCTTCSLESTYLSVRRQAGGWGEAALGGIMDGSGRFMDNNDSIAATTASCSAAMRFRHRS